MNSPSGANPYISLEEAKEQLAIDVSLTLHDKRINRLIGAAIDWAENFTGRSLGELMELDTPSDGVAVPLPEPKDSPHFVVNPNADPFVIGAGGANFNEKNWENFYQNNPIDKADPAPLRRDIKEAILLRIELLFDRNVDNWELIDKTTTDMLFPYRIGMGV